MIQEQETLSQTFLLQPWKTAIHWEIQNIASSLSDAVDVLTEKQAMEDSHLSMNDSRVHPLLYMRSSGVVFLNYQLGEASLWGY